MNLDTNIILFVGMADSPHFQKWLFFTRQVFPKKQLLVFPSDRPKFMFLEKEFDMQLLINQIKFFKLFPINRINFAIYFILDKLFGMKWRAFSCKIHYSI